MKPNRFGLAAIIIAIVICSFKTKWNTIFYFVYSSGAHNSPDSYLPASTTFQWAQKGDAALAWFSFESLNNQVEVSEWINAFEALDIINDGNNSLDDDIEGSKTFSFNGTKNLEARLEKKD